VAHSGYVVRMVEIGDNTMRWLVLRCRRAGIPAEIDSADDADLMKKVQAMADDRMMGELDFDFMTDQVEVYFFIGPKIKRFMTLMAN